MPGRMAGNFLIRCSRSVFWNAKEYLRNTYIFADGNCIVIKLNHHQVLGLLASFNDTKEVGQVWQQKGILIE